MALLPNVFVPEDVKSDFEVMPAGWIEAEIIKSEIKTTNDKEGKYIALTFKITEEGDHLGRLVFTNLNIVNKSDIAVKIAQSDLKAICTAVDFSGELEDTVDLHNIPMLIKLSVKAETAQWPAKNEIKGFKVA
jgi:hypothetical protein